MTQKTKLKAALLFVAAAIIVMSAVIAALPSCNDKLEFSARYFFVCYENPDDALSASTISSTVQSFGGAGYIVKIGEGYRVVVACYYSKEDAEKVIGNLSEEGRPVTLVEAYIGGYDFPYALKGEMNGIAGALAKLNELGAIYYSLANALDGGTLSPQAAEGVLAENLSVLRELKATMSSNALGEEIAYLVALAEEVSAPVAGREARALQVAVCDAILNVNFC